ncbi:LuxR C-terminal-related transcriptional regulator [Streptomyces sp. NPDC087425]|uniref:LuxR family transcriptional regulator AbsR2 n=1 Tax=Streptomyces sp. NPDC087425 TaxID=3365787 RepID=UPI0038128D9B
MTTFERDAKTLELPWPFTAREDELELVRRSLTAGAHGILVTGPAGCGKSRLVTEAVRGTDRARVAGTPETRHLPFAAFAHLLPETPSLHRAVQLLSAVRLLVVDDAHLLDDASAALVHQLAVHGRTRLLVVAEDDAPLPGAVARLWTGELLPRLALEPLGREDVEQVLAAGVAGTPEPLTLNRLHRLCRGDLRLLRDLLDAAREHGALERHPDTGTWSWRGPLPLTSTVRAHCARVLERTEPAERETLDRLAFAETVAPPADDFDLRTLEHLEAAGLIHLDDRGTVSLAHPLYGPALRAAAGRLRARRLARTPQRYGRALDAESAALRRRLDRGDLRPLASPVAEWLVEEGTRVPAAHAALRARAARLRGELREAAAWAREGLRDTPGDPSCRAEVALAAAQSGDATGAGEAVADGPVPAGAAVWLAVVGGDTGEALELIYHGDEDPLARYDAVRLGAPEKVADQMPHDSPFARHADALVRADGPALDRVAAELEEHGYLLFAAEAYAQAVPAHRDPSASRTARTRAVALAARCQGARTPALSGLVLGELTARQRQIVTLAAAGLSNRQIAEQLTLSIRTVGNHLYSAYTRLGASDRGDLPWLVRLPDTRTA